MRIIQDRFTSRLTTMDEAPESLLRTLRAMLKADDIIHLLLFGPANKIPGQESPATLLALLDSEWVVVSGTEDIKPSVVRCSFAATLLVEITTILLYGKLRFDFTAEGRTESVAVYFNTMMEGLYHEAAQLVMNGMDDISAIMPGESNEPSSAFESLPLEFRNVMLDVMPRGQHTLALVHWPADLGHRLNGLRKELAPEAVLALTQRELLFISEETTKSLGRPGSVQKYGSVVTHCPLSRLAGFHLSEHDQLETIDVELYATEGGEKLKIDYPGEQKTEVVAFMERVIKQRSAAGRELERT